MISLSDVLDIDVNDDSNLNDIVTKLSEHHWKVGFKFIEANRNPKDTPKEKAYGSGDTFEQIYNYLKGKGWDFLDAYFDEIYPYSDVKTQGDELLSELNAEIGISVDTIITSKDEVFQFSAREEEDYKRVSNAYERYQEQSEKFFDKQEQLDYQRDRFYSQQELYHSQLEEQQRTAESLEDEMRILEENTRKTLAGNLDRRTTGYHRYVNALSELEYIRGVLDRISADFYTEQENLDRVLAEYEKASEKYDKAKANLHREQTRYDNTARKRKEAVDNLSKIKSSQWDTINKKYESASTEFAENVKDDILSKVMNGELPIQSLPLAESTIKKRLYVGLEAYPRFWATEQLVRSVIVTCTLV